MHRESLSLNKWHSLESHEIASKKERDTLAGINSFRIA